MKSDLDELIKKWGQECSNAAYLKSNSVSGSYINIEASITLDFSKKFLQDLKNLKKENVNMMFIIKGEDSRGNDMSLILPERSIITIEERPRTGGLFLITVSGINGEGKIYVGRTEKMRVFEHFKSLSK